ncbi:MAG: alanine--tRNA ligase, partial [Actinomycetota bacterium]
ERVLRNALAEEAGFTRTLDTGLQVLSEAISQSAKELSGEVAFQLHDTFGFPIDLTVEIAEENGLGVDRAKFDLLMQEQKQRAKSDAKAKKVGGAGLQVYSEFRALGETRFLGYQSLETSGSVLGLLHEGESVSALSQGQLGEVFLDQTTLYAESGGQSADAGWIRGDGFELEVLDVQKPVKGLFAHRVRVTRGEVVVGAAAQTQVDADWRLGAAQAHSATHVVHAALRQVLGPEALQSGSFNKPGYMRLDFSWTAALSEETKSEIEEVSNLAIRADLAVSAQFMSLPEAKKWGAVALFGETYDEEVRVVQVGGPWSRELCGGTHVSRSSQIGLVSVTSESSVGSGSRRIEALVGLDALHSLSAERDLVRRLSVNLKAPVAEVEARIMSSLEELRSAQRRIAELESAQALALAPALVTTATKIAGLNVVAQELTNPISTDQLRALTLEVARQLPDCVVILGASLEKPVVMVSSSQKAQQQGIRAGELAKVASAVLGGGGGGKADFAQGGGVDSAKMSAALHAAVSAIG